jgi:hypothetical protein
MDNTLEGKYFLKTYNFHSVGVITARVDNGVYLYQYLRWEKDCYIPTNRSTGYKLITADAIANTDDLTNWTFFDTESALREAEIKAEANQERFMKSIQPLV